MKLVGKIKEAHGLRGEVYVLIFSGDISWLPRLKSFGVGALPDRGQEPGDGAVAQTFTCQKAKPFKKGLILKPTEFSDRNAAEAVEGRGFYVPEEFLEDVEEGLNLQDIEGFAVRDPAQKVLGEVVGFSSNGVQDLLVLKTPEGREAEVPFVDAFLRKIDFKKRIVLMELPDGLLELTGVERRDDGNDEPDEGEDQD